MIVLRRTFERASSVLDDFLIMKAPSSRELFSKWSEDFRVARSCCELLRRIKDSFVYLGPCIYSSIPSGISIANKSGVSFVGALDFSKYLTQRYNLE